MHVPINVKSPNNISEWNMEFNSAFKGLTESSSVEKSEEHGSIFVFNCASLLKYVLGSGCRLLPFVNPVLDNSEWFASRSDRCEPGEEALCTPK
jgi:hypothetical protein